MKVQDGQNELRQGSDPGRDGDPLPDPLPVSYGERQFQCLVWLAWELRCLGVAVNLDMRSGCEPALLVKAAKSIKKITAEDRGGNGLWVLRWGRGKDQWARIGEPQVVNLIRKAVQ